MDYDQLSSSMLLSMKKIRDSQIQKQINASMQGEMFVLQYLAHQGHEMSPSEISDAMQVSTARVAATLNSLEDKGRITRQIDPDDRRRILVGLTSAGSQEAEEHSAMVLGNVAEILRGLGEQDAQEFVRIIGRLAEIFTQRAE